MQSLRQHLKYLCLKTLQKECLVQTDVYSEEVQTQNLLEFISAKEKDALTKFISAFVMRTIDQTLLQSIARLLLLLLGDAPISAIIPYKWHDHFLQTCNKVKNGENISVSLETMKDYGIHLSNTLS